MNAPTIPSFDHILDTAPECAKELFAAYAITHTHNVPGERSESDMERLMYADELVKIAMTEPHDDEQAEKLKRAMEVEL